uniref:NPYR-16 n=1 Tax=Schmidtea mediterranea TaxID=79327 RepID=A0A193KUI8_SCHMD|nr:NPYR-16 [Schmidtea mediterranea]
MEGFNKYVCCKFNICGSNLSNFHSGQSIFQIKILEIFNRPEYASYRLNWVQYFMIFAYSLVTLIGLLINVIVFVALCRCRVLSNVTNLFVLSLTLSDIILCGVNSPIQIFYVLNRLTKIPDWACKFLFSCFGVPIYVSSLLIMLISIDRYKVILYPFKKRITKRRAFFEILLVFSYSSVSIIPVAMFTQNSPVTKSASFIYCMEKWPNKNLRLIYSIFTFFGQFFIPLLVSGILYRKIYCCLQRRTSMKRDIERKERTNRLLAGVVICFGMCWSPWCLFSLILEIIAFLKISSADFNEAINVNMSRNTSSCKYIPIFKEPNLLLGPHTILVDLILKLVALFSACINPLLYGWMNDPIRESIRRVFNDFTRTIFHVEYIPTENINFYPMGLTLKNNSTCPACVSQVGQFSEPYCQKGLMSLSCSMKERSRIISNDKLT